MSDDTSPNWNLLPHDPQAFFELSDGYDRKDLKRAYNKWLRQFKPEKFPAEFQKLRQAYEYLESQERYSQSYTPPPPDLSGVSSQQSSTESSSSESIPESQEENIEYQPQVVPPQAPAQEPSWKTQLPNVDPRELYQQLKAKQVRSADDYAALAILSDSLKLAYRKNFALWLIDGLSEYPHDGTLNYLLRSLFGSQQLDEKSMEEVLLKLSKVINNDRFYHLAEPLLDQYFNLVPWEQFKRFLADYQRNVQDYKLNARVAYMCHLLRRAIWKAPPEECAQLIAYLEKNGEFLNRDLEFDFETNLLLMEYVRTRAQFIEGRPIAQMIDRSLQSYCLASYDVGLHKVIECQQYIAQHPNELFAQFGLNVRDTFDSAKVWLWVSDSVLREAGVYQEPPADLQESLKGLSARFKDSIDTLGILLLRITKVSISVVAVLFGLLVMIIGVLPGIIFLAVYFRKVKPDIVDLWFDALAEGILMSRYRERYRDSVARYHAATHISYEDTLAAMQEFQSGKKSMKMLDKVCLYYRYDSAMAFYAAAVKFDC